MSVERPIEIELKYRLSDLARGERLLAADVIGPFRGTGASPSLQFEDQYLDTRDGALARAGFAARLRTTRSTLIVSLKALTAEGSGSMHRRAELEGPATRTLIPAEWPPSAARSLVLELCGDAPLEERLTIRQLRRKRRLVSGVAIVELSLDEVDVLLRAEVVDRFVELEAELVAGTESDLEPLRAILDREPGLEASRASKLQAAVDAIARRTGRPDPWLAPVAGVAAGAEAGPGTRSGWASAGLEAALGRIATDDGELVGLRPEPEADEHELEESMTDAAFVADAPEPIDAQLADDHAADAEAEEAQQPPEAEPQMKSPGVTADDVVAEAGRKVMHFHFQRLLAREPGVRAGKDAEEVHAMRVATRRLRAAWRVFGDGYRPADRRRQNARLREVAMRLGAVRDLDVQLIGLDAYREHLPEAEQDALKPLVDEWRRRRETARTQLMRELDSDGYRSFVGDLSSFVQTPGAGAARTEPTAPHRVRDTAGSRIWASYEGVRAFEPILRWADVPTLHELRIRAKWLRYGLEFVREALGPETSLLIKRVVALQDHLGLMNDADVGVAAARGFLVQRASRLSEEESGAIGRYLLSREREVTRLRGTVSTPWKAVASPAFRRALGRSLATL